MKKDAAPRVLIFQWPEPPAISRPLLGCIGLSLLAHALSFYVFQITYPPSAHITPPPAQLSILTPGSAENDAVLRWLDAEDPALAAKPPETVPPGALDVRYTPSFAEVRAVPKTAEQKQAAPQYPAAVSGIALVQRSLPVPPSAEQPASAPKTQLGFSGGLKTRAIIDEPPRKFSPSQLAELQPACFLVGVSDRGEVRYVFLRKSSGDKALDQEAESHLARTGFSAAVGNVSPIEWGFATFAWGSDVFAPAARTPSAP